MWPAYSYQNVGRVALPPQEAEPSFLQRLARNHVQNTRAPLLIPQQEAEFRLALARSHEHDIRTTVDEIVKTLYQKTHNGQLPYTHLDPRDPAQERRSDRFQNGNRLLQLIRAEKGDAIIQQTQKWPLIIQAEQTIRANLQKLQRDLNSQLNIQRNQPWLSDREKVTQLQQKIGHLKTRILPSLNQWMQLLQYSVNDLGLKATNVAMPLELRKQTLRRFCEMILGGFSVSPLVAVNWAKIGKARSQIRKHLETGWLRRGLRQNMRQWTLRGIPPEQIAAQVAASLGMTSFQLRRQVDSSNLLTRESFAEALRTTGRDDLTWQNPGTLVTRFFRL